MFMRKETKLRYGVSKLLAFLNDRWLAALISQFLCPSQHKLYRKITARFGIWGFVREENTKKIQASFFIIMIIHTLA